MQLQWTDVTDVAWAQIWQVTLLVIVVAILARLLARNRPHLAYALWLVVLVKCVTPPLLTSASGVFCWLQPVEHVAMVETPVLSDPVTLAAPPDDVLIPLHPIESVQAVPAESPMVAETPQFRFSPTDLAVCGLIAWAIGATVSLALSTWRWQACLRTARRIRGEGDAELAEHVQTLAHRLGLYRRVRVIVTAAQLGPAVTGILRPTLLIPEEMLASKTSDELEPILVHELIHIRRGDLWAGLLQTVVQALWWFHPLVRWAVRQAMREAEHCCDEAVLTELGCKPKDYARSLLGVLQYKMEWAPAPAFPGAGRIGGTAERLERIMRLRQGGYRRSPWWCWMVTVATAVVVLPGGAFVVSAEGKEGGGQARPGRSTAAPSVRTYDDITRNELAGECLRRYGEDILESMTNKMLLIQECRKQGIQVTEEERDAEIDRMASRFRLSVDRWLKMLEEERGIAPARYSNDIIYPTLALRKLAHDEIAVTDDDLKMEYEKRYGPSVKVRAIVCKSLEKAQTLHAAVKANPGDFGVIAKGKSEDADSASLNGRIAPVRRHAGHKQVVDAAFAMQPGDISPVIQVPEHYVILKCEGRLPGKKVDFHDAIPLLKESIRETKLRTASTQLFQEMQKKAQVVNVFNDPVKRKENPEVAAFVNGQPIRLVELAGICVERYGDKVSRERQAVTE